MLGVENASAETAAVLWTWPVIVSTSLAAAAFIVAAFALAWQIIEWKRSGPRLRVECRRSVLGGELPAEAVTISVTNIGRMSTVVDEFAFTYRTRANGAKNKLVNPFRYWISGSLPVNLPPGATEDWHFNPRMLTLQILDHDVNVASLRAQVSTGHTKKRTRVDRAIRARLIELMGEYPDHNSRERDPLHS